MLRSTFANFSIGVLTVVILAPVVSGFGSSDLYSVETRIGAQYFKAVLTPALIRRQNAKSSSAQTAWGFAETAAIATTAAEKSVYESWIVRLHSVELDSGPLFATPICVVRFSVKADFGEGLLPFIVLPNGTVVTPRVCEK